MQVHDELVFEVPQAEIEWARERDPGADGRRRAASGAAGGRSGRRAELGQGALKALGRAIGNAGAPSALRAAQRGVIDKARVRSRGPSAPRGRGIGECRAGTVEARAGGGRARGGETARRRLQRRRRAGGCACMHCRRCAAVGRRVRIGAAAREHRRGNGGECCEAAQQDVARRSGGHGVVVRSRSNDGRHCTRRNAFTCRGSRRCVSMGNSDFMSWRCHTAPSKRHARAG